MNTLGGKLILNTVLHSNLLKLINVFNFYSAKIGHNETKRH